MSGRKRYKYDKRAFKTRLDELFAEVKATHTKSILGASLILQGEIRKTLSIPGTGRLYKARGVTRRLSRKGTKAREKQTHRASSPGDPPAVDTGFLRASVVLNPQSDGSVKVGPAADYAATLEYGTQRPKVGVGPRRGPPVNRKHLANALRNASASRSLVSSVANKGSGTRAARPFMQRSVDAAKDKMKEHIISELQIVFREAARKA